MQISQELLDRMTRTDAEIYVWAKDIAIFANRRASVYGEKEIVNTFLQMSIYEREKFVKFLRLINHPSIYEPGTEQHRFERFCLESKKGD